MYNYINKDLDFTQKYNVLRDIANTLDERKKQIPGHIDIGPFVGVVDSIESTIERIDTHLHLANYVFVIEDVLLLSHHIDGLSDAISAASIARIIPSTIFSKADAIFRKIKGVVPIAVGWTIQKATKKDGEFDPLKMLTHEHIE